MDGNGFFYEYLGRESLISSADRATGYLEKMIDRYLLERTMIGTNDRHFGVAVYILNFGIVVAIPMDCHGIFNEYLRGESLSSCAVRATGLAVNVIDWFLRERPVIGANDRDGLLTVYILNL